MLPFFHIWHIIRFTLQVVNACIGTARAADGCLIMCMPRHWLMPAYVEQLHMHKRSIVSSRVAGYSGSCRLSLLDALAGAAVLLAPAMLQQPAAGRQVMPGPGRLRAISRWSRGNSCKPASVSCRHAAQSCEVASVLD